MSASLVGSEMCIRDRARPAEAHAHQNGKDLARLWLRSPFSECPYALICALSFFRSGLAT
eukprot:4114337-Alexandrium_andersonii.AAC.1